MQLIFLMLVAVAITSICRKVWKRTNGKCDVIVVNNQLSVELALEDATLKLAIRTARNASEFAKFCVKHNLGLAPERAADIYAAAKERMAPRNCLAEIVETATLFQNAIKR